MNLIYYFIYAALVGVFASIIGYPVVTHPIQFFAIVIPLDIIGYIIYLCLDDN